MRRIKIDKNFILNVETFNSNLFSKRRFKKPIENLKSLKKLQKGKGSISRKEYIQEIIDNYDSILNASPQEMKRWIKEFNDIIDVDLISSKFSTCIVEALRYEDLREKEFLEILQTMGIKSCIYCNAQLTVVMNLSYDKGKVSKRKATLELDHYYPKTIYPFLCTSFFNLLPVCAYCNKAKSKEKADFYLYTKDDNKLDVFNFILDKKSVLKYWASKDINDIKFEFTSGNKTLLKNHNKLFKIKQLYSTQLDLIEELLHKAEVYNNSYQKTLVKDFKKLFPDKALLKRLIVGNYFKPEEIHRRPMAKFTQDIAMQLKLI